MGVVDEQAEHRRRRRASTAPLARRPATAAAECARRRGRSGARWPGCPTVRGPASRLPARSEIATPQPRARAERGTRSSSSPRDSSRASSSGSSNGRPAARRRVDRRSTISHSPRISRSSPPTCAPMARRTRRGRCRSVSASLKIGVEDVPGARDAGRRTWAATPSPLLRAGLVEPAVGVAEPIELVERSTRIGQVALVVLHDHRDAQSRASSRLRDEVLPRLAVRLALVGLRVRDEDDAVGALQHDLARGLVHRLARAPCRP